MKVDEIEDIFESFSLIFIKVKVKWSRYRPDVAQRVGRGIALLFHDCGTRRGWVISSTPRPHFTPRKGPVSILQEAGWAPGPVCTGGKISSPTGIRSRTVQLVAQSLYRLSYRAHKLIYYFSKFTIQYLGRKLLKYLFAYNCTSHKFRML